LTADRPRFTLTACPISARPEPAHDPLTHYVIVRRDLPRGLLAAQIVHAAGESSPGNLDDGTFAVVLAAADEPELAAIERRLGAAGLAPRAIREPDLGGALTALGLPPAPKSSMRRWLSSIPLYR
jgi:peptidyl-tRNA hydrolase